MKEGRATDNIGQSLKDIRWQNSVFVRDKGFNFFLQRGDELLAKHSFIRAMHASIRDFRSFIPINF